MDMQVISLDLKLVITTILSQDMKKVMDTVTFMAIIRMLMVKGRQLPYITSRIKMDFIDPMTRQMLKKKRSTTKSHIITNLSIIGKLLLLHLQKRPQDKVVWTQ